MSIPGVSRFHAIVAATPLQSTGPPVIEHYRPSGYESWGGIRFQNTATAKRRREPGEAGPSTVKKVARRSGDDEGSSSREPTIVYRNRDELMKALQERFKQGPDVDFHGSYEVVDSEPSHKVRIQTVANEIWKTTGYRFTVKDHPQFTNGHKTRFWCSQDDAHRSKSSRAARKAQGNFYKPRTTSAGEIMAKARFPCRSRLLISSRDCHHPETRMLTIRMHHHVAHEPYVDINLPPEVAQGVWDNYGWIGHGPGASGSSTSEPPLPIQAVPEEEEEPSQEENTPEHEHDVYEHLEDQLHHEIQQDMHEMPQEIHPPPPIMTHNHHHEPPPPSPSPLPPLPPPQTVTIQPSIPPPPVQVQVPVPVPDTSIYHRQMQAHIRNLREFCDGLEYQLQFNDYRMLEVLERDGGQFLNLVADCLRKEGRLVTVDQPDMVHPVAMQTNGGPMMNGSSGSVPMASMTMHRSYEGNPGINPRALGGG